MYDIDKTYDLGMLVLSQIGKRVDHSLFRRMDLLCGTTDKSNVSTT